MGLGYAIETRKPAESYWTSLRFLLWYRFLIGGLLSATAHWSATLTEYVPEDFRPTFESCPWRTGCLPGCRLRCCAAIAVPSMCN